MAVGKGVCRSAKPQGSAVLWIPIMVVMLVNGCIRYPSELFG